jgi:hypothetical protein
MRAPQSADRDDRERSLSALAADPGAARHPREIRADGSGAATADARGARPEAPPAPRSTAEVSGADAIYVGPGREVELALVWLSDRAVRLGRRMALAVTENPR